MKIKFLLFLAFTALLFSCNKIPDHAKYIPKNAQLVGAIDMNKMGKKLIWNALTGSELFKNMQKNMGNEDSKNAMKDISNIGLNQSSTVYFYLNGKQLKESSSCIVAGMKDAQKFEAFLQKTYPGISTEKGEGYSSALIEHKMLTAWNKEAALFYPLHTSFGSDSNAVSVDLNNLESLKTELKDIFSMSKSNSILSNAHFKTLQNDGHDISVWMNYEELYTNNADPSSNPFIKMEYFKESGLALGIDFEKGKASAEMDYYMSNEMASIYKKYAPKNIDLNLIKKIPSNDIDMIAAYNLNPEMIQAYLKKFGLDGLLNMGLGMAGTSMDNISSTFTGDLVAAITDMKMKAKIDTVDYDENSDRSPDMNLTFAMGIKDEKGLEKLLGIGVKNNMLTKNGSSYSLPNTNSKSGLAFDKKALVYSSDATLSSAYLSGKSNDNHSIPASVWSHFSNPMVLYVDIKRVMQCIPSKPESKEEEEFMIEAKKLFTYIEFYGGKMKNNAVHVEGAMFLSNENENALIQLLDIGMKAQKMNEKKDATNPMSDSSSIQ